MIWIFNISFLAPILAFFAGISRCIDFKMNNLKTVIIGILIISVIMIGNACIIQSTGIHIHSMIVVTIFIRMLILRIMQHDFGWTSWYYWCVADFEKIVKGFEMFPSTNKCCYYIYKNYPLNSTQKNCWADKKPIILSLYQQSYWVFRNIVKFKELWRKQLTMIPYCTLFSILLTKNIQDDNKNCNNTTNNKNYKQNQKEFYDAPKATLIVLRFRNFHLRAFIPGWFFWISSKYNINCEIPW